MAIDFRSRTMYTIHCDQMVITTVDQVMKHVKLYKTIVGLVVSSKQCTNPNGSCRRECNVQFRRSILFSCKHGLYTRFIKPSSLERDSSSDSFIVINCPFVANIAECYSNHSISSAFYHAVVNTGVYCLIPPNCTPQEIYDFCLQQACRSNLFNLPAGDNDDPLGPRFLGYAKTSYIGLVQLLLARFAVQLEDYRIDRLYDRANDETLYNLLFRFYSKQLLPVLTTYIPIVDLAKMVLYLI